MSDDLERVARALSHSFGEGPDNTDPRVPGWVGWHDWVDGARAAIAAMPEIAALKAERDALREALDRADKFLVDVVDCPDPNDLAADGGITVFMVMQHDARYLRTKLARALIGPAQ